MNQLQTPVCTSDMLSHGVLVLDHVTNVSSFTLIAVMMACALVGFYLGARLDE